MMEPVIRVEGQNANPCEGKVKFDFIKSTWNLGMIVCALVFAPETLSLSSIMLFVILTYFTLLVGHSVGMHRMMIHRSFKCKPWVEKVLIYIGVIVGMSGPIGIIKIHDMRDWAQRHSQCHDFFSHRRNFLLDLWWQLTSVFQFKHPPKFNIESKYLNAPFYKHLES